MAGGSRTILFIAALVPVARALDDSVALLQASAESGRAASTGALSDSLGRGLFSTLPDAVNKFDCDKHPKMCEAPFNCHKVTGEMVQSLQEHGMAPDGHANLHTWCAPEGLGYEDYMHMCIVKKDLVAAAKIQYQWTINKHQGIEELDGSYCFIEGHCTDMTVNKFTTLKQADRMCDQRYGMSWREAGSAKSAAWALTRQRSQAQIQPGLKGAGFRDTNGTEYFLKMACAMGNYHCDVMYCKETYCKNPYFVKKYGHLLPKTNWYAKKRSHFSPWAPVR